jgi:hypothetical protein
MKTPWARGWRRVPKLFTAKCAFLAEHTTLAYCSADVQQAGREAWSPCWQQAGLASAVLALSVQQAFTWLQHSLPSLQQSGAVVQQAEAFLQHSIALSQQPGLSLSLQQPSFFSQQASFCSQQFLAAVSAFVQAVAVTNPPIASATAATVF